MSRIWKTGERIVWIKKKKESLRIKLESRNGSTPVFRVINIPLPKNGLGEKEGNAHDDSERLPIWARSLGRTTSMGEFVFPGRNDRWIIIFRLASECGETFLAAWPLGEN